MTPEEEIARLRRERDEQKLIIEAFQRDYQDGLSLTQALLERDWAIKERDEALEPARRIKAPLGEALAIARNEYAAQALDEAAKRLASEAETVCDLFGGDKSVDALRAALSDYLDKRAARHSESTE